MKNFIKSKSVKYFVLIGFLLMLCGCGEEEYQDYINAIGDGATCVYYPYNPDAYTTKDIDSITFTADKDGLDVTYKINGTSVTEPYITIEYDGNGEFKSIDQKDDHTVGDYKFSFSYFTLQNFFNNFKMNGNNCQQYIYLYDNRKLYFYETKYTELNDNFTYTFTTVKPSSNDDGSSGENEEGGGNTSVCQNALTDDCRLYTVNTYLDGPMTVELGRANGTEYYMVYDSGSSGINYNYNNTDSTGITINSYTYIIRGNDWDKLFPTESTYVDEIYLDEKALAGSTVAHITVPGSETITDYEMFGTPQQAGMNPVYRGDSSAETGSLNIEEVAFCEESGVLKTFQIIGYLLFIAKIIVPLLLIILGSIDFAKATISSDDKAPRDAVMALVRRVLIAVIIFFIPTILNFLLSLVYGATEAFSDDSFEGCTTCLFDPFGDCEAPDIGE